MAGVEPRITGKEKRREFILRATRAASRDSVLGLYEPNLITSRARAAASP